MGFGGLVRGRDKQWLGGFIGFVGLGSLLEVESLAVLAALNSFHKHFGLVKIIKALLAREWVVSFLHVYRDGNKPVDWLACQGARADFPVKRLDVSPPAVDTLVVFDSISRL
ncbi:Ribonuclease H-like superfamily [Sesbania bispinosa]|nr:Ribonuclease H-like superfamily [Sesbania bispinosa]